MNTVGKKGKLGEHVRCVVSVSMLTEGWDANTVTHILGVRAFGSQLLCEQVVGRGLRRRSYAVNDDGLLRAGVRRRLRHPVPVHLLRQADRRPAAAEAGRSRSRAVEGREHLRIDVPEARRLPRRAARRRDLARPRRRARCSRSARTRCRRWVEMGGVVGERELEEGDPTQYRPQQVAFALAKRILDDQLQHRRRQAAVAVPAAGRDLPGRGSSRGSVVDRRLQPRLPDDDHRGAGRSRPRQVWNAIVRHVGQPPRAAAPDDQPLRPRRLDRRRRLRRPASARCATEKSEVSHVTLDGKDGNTWEQLLAQRARAEPERRRRT